MEIAKEKNKTSLWVMIPIAPFLFIGCVATLVGSCTFMWFFSHMSKYETFRVICLCIASVVDRFREFLEVITIAVLFFVFAISGYLIAVKIAEKLKLLHT